MPDFNGAKDWQQERPQIDMDALSAALGERAGEWVPLVFPHGRRDDNGDWRLGGIDGRAPKKSGSCVIYLSGDHKGSWFDFAPLSGPDGGQALSTLKEGTGLDGRSLIAKAQELAGASFSMRLKSAASEARKSDEAAHVLFYSKPIAGTLGEEYLRARHINLDLDNVSLKFNPSTSFWETGKPPMAVPAIAALDGAPQIDAPAKPRTLSTSDRALEELRTVILDRGILKAPNVKEGIKGTERAVSLDTWRDRLYLTGIVDKDGANPRTAFKRIQDNLTGKALIRIFAESVWLLQMDATP